MGQLKNLLVLKLTLLKNGFHSLRRRSPLEFIVLIVFFFAAGFGLFYFFYQSFRFFNSQEPFGPILIDETFYLFNLALFAMLFISSAVSSYASLFQSKEVAWLLTKPVAWIEIYLVKLLEALWFSSWSFLFVTVPFMAAYALVKNAGLFPFPFLCLAVYLPFILLAGMLGTLAATLTVWLLPGRNSRRAALMVVLALFGFAFMKMQPQLLKEQGSIAGIMSGYLPHIAFAKSALLPSYWTTRSILALSTLQTREILGWQEGVFYLLVLLSNALFFLIPLYSAGSGLYPASYLRAQDHGESRGVKRGRRDRTWFEKTLDGLAWPSRPALAFLEKDLKTFSRDPSEWSQLLIFFGLLLFYFINLRNLEFHVLKTFWKNLVFVLNTIGTYIVLSSFSMRFVFPMLSLEGSKSWMIGVAPMRFSSLIMEKFLLGIFFSGVLTLPLIFLSGWMLEVPLPRVAFMAGTGFFVCVALTGLSVGFGARFPNFRSHNPAEIISGFGGSMLLVTHLAYLAVVGVFLMKSQDPHWVLFIGVAAISLFVAGLPLKMGVSALERMEF